MPASRRWSHGASRLGARRPAHADHQAASSAGRLTPTDDALDDRRRHWGIPDAAAGFLAGFVGSGLAGGLWGAFTGTSGRTLGTLLAGLVGLWVGNITVALLVSRWKGSGSLVSDFGLRLRAGVDLVVGVLAGLASTFLLLRLVYAVLVAAGVFDQASIDRLDEPATDLVALASGANVIALFVFVGLLAPIVEELFFRGLLQQALVRRAGPVVGVAASAVLFAAAHLQPLDTYLRQFPGLAAFGAVLGVLAHRTGRLGPGIVAHVVFNGVTLVSLLTR